MSGIEKEFNKKVEMLNVFKETVKDPKMEKLMDLQVEWDSKINELKSTVQTLLEKDKGNFAFFVNIRNPN